MTQVLLTGASGFVGRPCLAALRERGIAVHAVARRIPPGAAGAGWRKVDLLDPAERSRLMSELRPSHWLHLAWYAEHGKYWTAPENFAWVAASLDLLREFQRHGGRRVVMAGTCAEYEWGGAGPLHETQTPRKPATPYGRCKHHLQELFDEFRRMHGLSGAWARLFFLYGPGEDPARLVASVARALIRDEPAECTHGRQLRDFLYVEDAAAALVELMLSEVQGPVNVASGDPVRIAEVVETLAEAAGGRDRIRLGARPAAAGEADRIVADATRLREEVGWRPRWTLQQGLERSLEYWKRETAGEREPCD